MAIWTFFEYVSASGRGEITEWTRSLPPSARARFDSRLEHLQNLDRNDWRRPWFDLFAGEEGVGEIRFTAERAEYRVFGAFGPARHQFTMLIGCVEKQKKNSKAAYAPSQALQTARERAHQIHTEGRVQPYDR